MGIEHEGEATFMGDPESFDVLDVALRRLFDSSQCVVMRASQKLSSASLTMPYLSSSLEVVEAAPSLGANILVHRSVRVAQLRKFDTIFCATPFVIFV